jgi:hypothetical protein
MDTHPLLGYRPVPELTGATIAELEAAVPS